MFFDRRAHTGSPGGVSLIMTTTPQIQNHNDTAAGRILLAWDAPNIMCALWELNHESPTQGQRPRFAALRRWLDDRAGPEGLAEGCVFLNVKSDGPRPTRFVEQVRQAGFWVFALPKHGTSDVDGPMVKYLKEECEKGDVAEVIVASHDRRCFAPALHELRRLGVRTTVIGFAERSLWATRNAEVDFVDLESIPDVFADALPRRAALSSVPRAGGFYPPAAMQCSGTSDQSAALEREPQHRGLLSRILGRGQAA